MLAPDDECERRMFLAPITGEFPQQSCYELAESGKPVRGLPAECAGGCSAGRRPIRCLPATRPPPTASAARAATSWSSALPATASDRARTGSRARS